ncbi:response regulator transcription factor [Methylothermus subterraneus]
MQLLLVEDDALLADGLSRSLSRLGFAVVVAATASEAEAALWERAIDLMLLDLSLPDRDGLEVLKALRRRGETIPVLILTARDGLDDRVLGLERGADDYLVKPFELRELEARIRALIRRSYYRFGHPLGVGRLVLTPATRQLLGEGRSVRFSRREYAVLELLWVHAGQVVSKDRIARRLTASGVEEPSENAIEILIHRLRRRLKPWGVSIRTLRGLGYMLEVENG